MVWQLGRLASVAVVKSSHHWQSDDLTSFRRFNRTRFGTILVESSVRAMAVIILKILGEHVVQMSSLEHNHLVQTLAPDGADQALSEGILPGRTGSYRLWFQPQCRGTSVELQAVNAARSRSR